MTKLIHLIGMSKEVQFDNGPKGGYSSNDIPVLPSVNIKTWGLKYDSDDLLSGLISWPSYRQFSEVDTPLSSLGHKADQVYNLGYWELPETAAQLDVFAGSCFPEKIQGDLKFGIARYLAGVATKDAWNRTSASGEGRKIWQTAPNGGKDASPDVQSWRNGKAQEEDWGYQMIHER